MPKCLTHMCAQCRFQRVFIAIGHSVQVGRLFAIGYFGVDAAFSKHHIFQQGYLHLLTMRDGNARQMPLAWAMCETESGPTYEWFALWCKKAGLGHVLAVGTLIMSDRQKGIGKFMEAFLAAVGSCFKHILVNCKGHIAGTGRSFNQGLAWELQEARTFEDFRSKLALIAAQSPRAAEYLDTEVDHEHTYKYMWLLLGIASFDLKTNNTTEGLNGTFVFARDQVPYRMNYMLCKWCGEHFAIHLAEALKAQAAGKLLTTWAEMLFRENVCAHARVPKVRVLKVTCAHLTHSLVTHLQQIEIAARSGHTVQRGGDGLYYVGGGQTGKSYEVDLVNKTCDCGWVTEFKMPCRHWVPVLHHQQMLSTRERTVATIKKYWPKWALVETWVLAYTGKRVKVPPIYSGPSKDPDADRMGPPVQKHKKAGRPS